jgi:hypothetical protein
MKILEDVAWLLESNGISYYVGCGTLLGLYRDGKLLDHDTDVDIEIFSNEDIGEELINIMSRNYTLSGFYRQNSKFGQIFFTGENDFVIDFSLFYQYSDEWMICTHPDFRIMVPNKMLKPRYLKLLRTYNDIEGYLELRYGDWRTPRTGDTWKGDGIQRIII